MSSWGPSARRRAQGRRAVPAMPTRTPTLVTLVSESDGLPMVPSAAAKTTEDASSGLKSPHPLPGKLSESDSDAGVSAYLPRRRTICRGRGNGKGRGLGSRSGGGGGSFRVAAVASRRPRGPRWRGLRRRCSCRRRERRPRGWSKRSVQPFAFNRIRSA